MTVTGVGFTDTGSGTAGSIAAAKATSENNSTISINDFFQLLSAQMQNQTMYDSMDTSDYMSQLVQYTTLAQLQELSASAATSYAVSLVGKNADVTAADENGNEMLLSGTVEEVAFQGGKPYALIDGAYYPTSDILAVRGTQVE